ncbi:GNAT family N-acetyltransferase [Tropicimonas aquimaris]|uniref:GNAT family N-acetyltransferase n=1 Tax=Tropicimonas aquimaris TaxID=914152 RepID=A0ABW3ISX4_9RHOB
MTDRRDEIKIKTPRLTLRTFRAADVPAIVEGIGDFEVSKWLAPVPHPYGPADAEQYLETLACQPHYWAIIREGDLIGGMAIDDSLGYWLARSAWGHGYATEAGFAVIDRWFADPAAPDLTSGHFDDNARSGGVLCKLGFEYTGRKPMFCRARDAEFPSRRMTLSRARWHEMRSLPHLTTPRCVLRPLTADDAPRLSEIGGIPEVARNTVSIPAPWPVDEARDWIAAGRWKERPGFRLGILDRKGQLIGMAGLSPADQDGIASVAYFVEKSLWGRGLVTEVMEAFIPAVFRAFPLKALDADHDTDNPASGAVLRKLGFDYLGDRLGARTRLRLEPEPVSHYRLERSRFEARL